MNRHNARRPLSSRREGIILLVVLSSLTFFSLLVAAYLVFSNQSRQSAFVLAARNTRAPDVNGLLNESLMTLIRGTGDVNNPFFGESLLDDYYGLDGIDMQVHRVAAAVQGPFHLGRGIIRFPVVTEMGANRPFPYDTDDLFSGRLITFREGPLENRTFRVIRSMAGPRTGTPPVTPPPPGTALFDDLYIEVGPNVIGATPAPLAVRSLFYADPNNLNLADNAFRFRLNGQPNSAAGIGFNGVNVNLTVGGVAGYQQPAPPPPLPPFPPPSQVGFASLPVALQPNHIRLPGATNVDKSALLATPGSDFDEGYDAADYFNWFLAHRHSDGTVIPSFHRPSVINYILNEVDWSGSPSGDDYRDALISIARATYRPIPIAEDMIRQRPSATVAGSAAIHPRFSGGSSSYALRSPMSLRRPNGDPFANAPTLLDQLAKALIEGPWDVDNDSDGIPDSVWVDLGLPMFTSPEGKLLRPLVAPMIEDLSARLNVNAVGNSQLVPNLAGSPNNPRAYWAGTRRPFGTLGPLNTTGNAVNVFRGIGYGPADVMIPASYSYTSTAATPGVIANVGILNNIAAMLNDRYRFGDQPLPVAPNLALPGRDGADPLDVLRTGWRPAIHNVVNGYGYGMSMDVYGRGGVALGRSGHPVAADSGRAITTVAPLINETFNDPYEMDPTGTLSGDLPFTVADLEAILRSDDFDSELLPQTLKNRLRILLRDYPEYRRSLTTLSSSDDSPETLRAGDASLLTGLIDLIQLAGGSILTRAQIRELIAPEIRLGRKLDVNRPFGNGVDDNANGIIDEPLEVAAETQAFAVAPGSGQTVPANYIGITPNYVFDSTTAIDGRELLARHLYVLMMALTRDPNVPANEFEFPSANGIGEPFTTAPGTTPGIPQDYKARRLAQWAVNVVDYRDPDSIMTRFVFDPNPFDAGGWNPGPPTPLNTVWGCEAPELMFTESAAFHDVRLVDGDQEGPSGTRKTDPTTPDNDSDQVRVPQGSVFLELYCPHPTLDPTAPADDQTKRSFPQELYTTVGGVPQLDLSRLAPAPTGVGGGTGVPIWRIAFSEPHYNGLPTADLAPEQLRNINPDSASPEPAQPDELVDAGLLSLQRYIWFEPFTDIAQVASMITANGLHLLPVNPMSADQVFFTPIRDLRLGIDINQDRTLEPGQFLVLAPRKVTHLGSKQAPVGSYPGAPSQQRFEVNYNLANRGLIQFEQGDPAFTAGVPTAHEGGGMRVTPMLGAAVDHTPALPLIVATFPPIGWPVAAFEDGWVGLNVSEPLPRPLYYPQPVDLAGSPDFRVYNGTADNDGDGRVDYPLRDAYLSHTDPTNHASLDQPLDVIFGILPNDSLNGGLGEEPQLGTLEQFCTAFLQRLADPTRPFDAITNPYRTVDWITVDLTVFSGEDREDSISGFALPYASSSRQRNGFLRTRDATGVVNTTQANVLFSNETQPLTSLALDPIAPDFFSFIGFNKFVQTSLSFLNTATTGNLNRNDPSNAIDTRHGRSNPGFMGFAPSIGRDPASVTVTGNDRNLPQIPYALHPWINRPFASHLELMMVPACSQGRLFEEFSINVMGMDPDIYPQAGAPTNPAVFHSPFRHLLNFFHSTVVPIEGGQFVRLFDFVHTLPRFRGEVGVIDPRSLTSTDPDQEAELSLLRTLLLPPFNLRYDNQRQGTVNLNSLAEFPVWAGLMQGHLNAGEFENPLGIGTATQLSFEQFVTNRRGYVVAPPPGAPSGITSGTVGNYNYVPGKLDPRFPTQFAGVYKQATDAPFAPLLRNANATDLIRRRGANGTLLRGAQTLDVNDPPGGIPDPRSLFVRDSSQSPLLLDPLMLHQNRDRNPLMRYQTLMRMPNLVSDNSQKFVIRMTMGFFEVDAGDINSVGEEYNASMGQNERYRAMFIIDRAKPVGFVPGEDMNSREIVIYESYEQ